MAAWDSIWAVVTFAAGMASTYLGKTVDERRAVKREERTREADRGKLILDRRETFELTHLQDLHAALGELGRLVGLVVQHEIQQVRAGAAYGHGRIPDPLDTELAEANRKVYTLTGLVLDHRLRVQVEECHQQLTRVARLRDVSEQEGQTKLDQADTKLWDVQEQVATEIRAIYEGF